ncbi:MAG: DUF4349 domain-containing protein [Candidatus Dormibacteria bacterium]
MFSRRLAIGLGFAAAAGVVAGCASTASTSAGISAAAPAASAAAGTTQGSVGTSARGIAIGVPQSAALQRSVRAAYSVPAGTFLTSFDGVIARAVALGGYVASSATSPESSGRIVAGSVTLEIPAKSIAIFLNGMPATYIASSIDFASVDHYAAFVDVNAELVSAHAHLHALDSLLAKATSLNDITTLEQQIEAVTVEIDTDQGQLNALTASVDMATATIALSERGATIVASAPGPLNDGLTGGWHNAVQLTGDVLDVVVTALPLLVIAALALAGWWLAPRWWRRVSRPAP